ncbi:MAG: glycosyltransferase family 4 protein [Acidobacteriia bacterium]|nr:glycosyltransferase family 4 protein [Terriglobia bacterium]
MNRILIDCERTKHPHTGLFHFCLQLGSALIRYADPGRERLTFYVPRGQRGLFGPGQDYFFYRRFHKFWIPRTRSFNLWHCTYQNSRLLPPSSNTRVVLTIHDLNFLVERKAEPAKIKKRIRQVQANIDRADHIVCISQFTLTTVTTHLRLGNRPVEVIYNGCNVNEFPAFDQPRYRPAHPYIFSLGTVLPKKNVHVLPCLLSGIDYELVIAGILNSDYEKVIRAAARHHGVQDRVHLLGPISEEEKSWYFRNCHAFAFPSLAEGFGFPVVEAMYYGKPVFLSDHTSLPEIGGSEAYYFTDFDPAAMQEVFNRGMRDYQTQGRAEQIRKRASRYSWDQAARDYLTVYRKWQPQ